MKQFEKAVMPSEVYDPAYYMHRFNFSYDRACKAAAQMCLEKYYINDEYQVHVSNVHEAGPWPDMVHLSIKRIDKEPIRDWRDMQEIKNIFVGEENEGIEIYPAESRLVDMANQFHSWVFADPKVRLPIPFYLETLMAKTGPKRKPVAERLWSKVDMKGGPDSCWEFHGATNGNGYGVLARPGESSNVTSYYVHRLAFCLANGLDYDDLDPKMEIMHSCDNRSCCNPQHLSLGTSKDNKKDAMSKGRMFWQKAQRNAKGQFEADDSDVEDD